MLDPDQKFDQYDKLSNIEREKIKQDDLESNLEYFIDRGNEIIKKLVTLEDLFRSKDTTLMHLLGDRDFQEEHEKISKLLYDFENSAMKLYKLKSKVKSNKKMKEVINVCNSGSKVKKMLSEFKLSDLDTTDIENLSDIFFELENLI
jgi:predicted RNase H-like nuclease (RuvC/YqgF family)